MLFESGSKAKENQILENTAFFEWKFKENSELIHVASKEDEFEAFFIQYPYPHCCYTICGNVY